MIKKGMNIYEVSKVSIVEHYKGIWQIYSEKSKLTKE